MRVAQYFNWGPRGKTGGLLQGGTRSSAEPEIPRREQPNGLVGKLTVELNDGTTEEFPLARGGSSYVYDRYEYRLTPEALTVIQGNSTHTFPLTSVKKLTAES
jgi:hypothetical protein